MKGRNSYADMYKDDKPLLINLNSSGFPASSSTNYGIQGSGKYISSNSLDSNFEDMAVQKVVLKDMVVLVLLEILEDHFPTMFLLKNLFPPPQRAPLLPPLSKSKPPTPPPPSINKKRKRQNYFW